MSRHTAKSSATIDVLAAGLLTSVQDRGRYGFAALGVGRAGPMDPVAARLANALAGNPGDAALLEITLSGPRLRFDCTTTIALAGAEFAATLDGKPVPGWRPFEVAAGSILAIGGARRGTIGYLAVAGGLEVGAVLGSAASDLNAATGPFDRPLQAGDRIAVGTPAPKRTRDPRWSLDPRPWFDPDPERVVHLIPGADLDALDEASQTALFTRPFRVSARSNRVGYRLDDVALALRAPLERISEPVVAGTMQLPPGGQPIVLMAEHPTSGGYPCIGRVAAVDRARLAQRRPGEPLRFAPISLDAAQTRYLERERELEALLAAIAERQNP